MAKQPSMSDERAGIIDLVLAVAPGLSLKTIFADVADELGHLGRQGAHELAAAMLRDHSGFILYPREGREAEAHGVHGAAKAVELEPPVRERDGPER